MDPGSPAGLLLMGKVLRPHGLGGLLRVQSYGEAQASFPRIERLFLRTGPSECHEYTVASVTPHKTVFLLKLEGVDSLDLAEKYRGADVLIRKETLARKDDEEYFWHELLGLEVRLDSGEYLGTLSRIIPTGSNDIYVVKDGKRESLIPATYEVVKEIDLDAGKMTVSPLEGLLELDEV